MNKPSLAASAASQFAQVNPLSDTIAQSQTLLNGLCETCSRESRAFFDDWARDWRDAVRGAQAARSPMDFLGVQQRWLLARGSAWIDASVRMFTGASLLTEDSVAALKGFRLPE